RLSPILLSRRTAGFPPNASAETAPAIPRAEYDRRDCDSAKPAAPAVSGSGIGLQLRGSHRRAEPCSFRRRASEVPPRGGADAIRRYRRLLPEWRGAPAASG